MTVILLVFEQMSVYWGFDAWLNEHIS